MEIIWSRLAKETLSAILEYIDENFNGEVAEKVYSKIKSHVDSLAFFPRIGAQDPRFTTLTVELRYIVNTPNIIHYAIIEDSIVIISVFDTRRSPDYINTVIADFLNNNKLDLND